MAADTSIPKFFDPERPPSPGRWHYWLDPDTRQYPINGNSADSVFDQLKRYQQNNGQYADDDTIWKSLWQYWCSLEPERCGGVAKAPPVKVELPAKEVWGPILWRFLNLAAASYNHDFFRTLISEMRHRLIACPLCRSHFDEILMRFPVEQVHDARTACRWANDVHNAVNASLGKSHYSYMQGVIEYGFPQ